MVGAIIGAAAQVGSSIYGAVKSSQANKQAQAMIQNQRDENKRWYDQKMAEDYMQRSDVQNVLRKQRELLNEQYQRARATNVVAGGTDESLALQQQAANEAMGNTMADIAANASAYKDSIEQQYRAKDDAINRQLIGVQQAKAQSIANAAGQVGSAVGGLMTGFVGDGKAGAGKSSAPSTPSASTAIGGTTTWDTEAQRYQNAFKSTPVKPINA